MGSNEGTLKKIEKLESKRKVDKILKFLDDSDDEIVIAAMGALSRIADEDSVNSVAHMIDSASPAVRKGAAEALSTIGTSYAKTYLQHRMVQEKDADVKAAILAALQNFSK